MSNLTPPSNPRANAASSVLMVSTSYPASLADWRGIFIRNLVYALAERTEYAIKLWAPPGEIPPNVEDASTAKERQWLARLMRGGGVAHIIRSKGVAGVTEPLRLLAMQRRVYLRHTPALYHINWLQNSLALPANGRPLLVSALGTDMQLLRLPLVRQLLKRNFRRRRTVICPNAAWMVEPLQAAFGESATVKFVPFGIAPHWFGIERYFEGEEKSDWLCVSRVTKGKIGHLLDWGAEIFSDGKHTLHLFGPLQEELTLPPWIRYHGPTTPGALRSEWFPRARGLITLSEHAEGRPQVVLEAMAAGLPVVASRLPAHDDLIVDGVTGILCNNAADVTRAVLDLDDAALNRNIGAAGQASVKDSTGTWTDCASRYTAIYEDLVSPRQ